MEEQVAKIVSQISPVLALTNEQWDILKQALRIAYCEGKVDGVQSMKTDLFKPLKY